MKTGYAFGYYFTKLVYASFIVNFVFSYPERVKYSYPGAHPGFSQGGGRTENFSHV